MSKKLTIELITQKAKTDHLENIKSINLWGNNLDDITLIQEMKQLKVISLSVNKISSLKPFKDLTNLKELSLRNNEIFDFNELSYLMSCHNLRVLWLLENPIAESRDYRLKVIQMLPQLTKLDNIIINEDERNEAKRRYGEQNYDNDYYYNYNYNDRDNVNNNIYIERDDRNDYNINEYEMEENGNVFENDNLMKASTLGYYTPNSKHMRNNVNYRTDNHANNKEYILRKQEQYQQKKINANNYNNKYKQQYINPINNKKYENYNIEHSKILQSVLLLIGELNKTELTIVQNKIQKSLYDKQMYD